MKSYKNIALQGLFILGIILQGTSCSENKSSDSKEVAEEINEEKFEKADNEKDAQFLVNAAEISLEEISLGKLAQDVSKVSHVKVLGKMMEEDHLKSFTTLTALAQSKMISIPETETEDAKDGFKKLSEKTGKDFDKTYSEKMVKGHKDAIELFEKASTESTDKDIRNFAASSLPKLKTHLEHAEICKKECDSM